MLDLTPFQDMQFGYKTVLYVSLLVSVCMPAVYFMLYPSIVSLCKELSLWCIMPVADEKSSAGLRMQSKCVAGLSNFADKTATAHAPVSHSTFERSRSYFRI
jgi:hypothetical protein